MFSALSQKCKKFRRIVSKYSLLALTIQNVRLYLVHEFLLKKWLGSKNMCKNCKFGNFWLNLRENQNLQKRVSVTI